MDTAKSVLSRSKIWVYLISFFILVIVCGLIWGLAMSTAAHSAYDTSTFQIDSVMKEDPNPESLPDYIFDSDIDIAFLQSARFITQSDNAKYWIGFNSDEELCFLAESIRPPAFAARSCATAEVFVKHGIGIGFSDIEHPFGTYLIPDALLLDNLPVGYHEVSPVIIEMKPPADDKTIVRLHRISDDRDVELRNLFIGSTP